MVRPTLSGKRSGEYAAAMARNAAQEARKAQAAVKESGGSAVEVELGNVDQLYKIQAAGPTTTNNEGKSAVEQFMEALVPILRNGAVLPII